ncbi:hypothetical protein Nepgr_010912 [Nepenthes gracilis]|uniref:Exostosin GT47 domain-containing protein n=1 Tax=Nepenthes gracilis TaxID=150966 RepID=A0AAD3XLH2_NEPGR|nr:hypothetical protein Nepgr_010912 [Nepenthes gracilis]
MVVLNSNHSSPDHLLKKPKMPDLTPDHISPTFPLLNLFSVHCRFCIVIFVLLLQALLLLLSYYRPSSFYPPRHGFPSSISRSSIITTSTAPASVTTTTSTSIIEKATRCQFGKIFVYDLPPMFNIETYRNCDKLNPWQSRCEALSNGGYGRQAAELSGVVPRNLVHAWYWTNQFASEIIFHHRILHHKCRTEEPDSAAAFYIPFYAGFAVEKYLWSETSAKERDKHCEMVLDWIQQQQPYFNRSNGLDHFITMGRITWDFRRTRDNDWGSHCIYTPAMMNITRLLIERNPWDYFDIGVPYPTGFHPSTDSDVSAWQEFVRSRDRKTLFCFAGATRRFIRNDFRGLLLSHCRNESDSCRVVDCTGNRCSDGTSKILQTFLDSDFCLQPRGDSFTRKSLFDCMLAGSIPVFFWRRTAYFQYQLFLPVEPESYSVFIHRDEVKNGTSLRRVLESYSKEEVRRMREKIVEFIPRIVYAKPIGGLENIKDAFEIAIDGVLKRIKEHKDKGYELNMPRDGYSRLKQ